MFENELRSFPDEELILVRFAEPNCLLTSDTFVKSSGCGIRNQGSMTAVEIEFSISTARFVKNWKDQHLANFQTIYKEGEN